MDLETKIYRLLCDGFSQRKIAVISGISRARVCQITKELIENKYIFCVNPNGNPKLYKPTDKPLPLKSPLLSVKRGGRSPNLTGVCRVHSLAFSLLLKRPPSVPFNWSKEWRINGTIYFQMFRTFDFGRVTIRLIQGKNGPAKIVFWLPEKYLDQAELKKYERLSNKYVNKVCLWFMRRYGCIVSDPEPYQKPHFAFPEDNEIIHLSKKYDVEGTRSWVDNSLGVPEWETSEIEVARAKIEGPERLLNLERQVSELYKVAGSINDKVDLLVDSLLCVPPKEDEKLEVT